MQDLEYQGLEGGEKRIQHHFADSSWEQNGMKLMEGVKSGSRAQDNSKIMSHIASL
jgi:hypothetical protein